jgi:hypothetical protein
MILAKSFMIIPIINSPKASHPHAVPFLVEKERRKDERIKN